MELSIRVVRALHDIGIKARLLITGAHDPHVSKNMAYYWELRNLARKLGIENYIFIMAEYVFKNGEKLAIDHITIRDLYLIADILFLPSLQEGFGIPLLESGMIKLPVVCSNIPSFLEIGGQDVTVFDLDDPPEKIAREILDFVDGLKPHQMFRKVIRNYAWDNIYREKLLPLLSEVVNTNRI